MAVKESGLELVAGLEDEVELTFSGKMDRFSHLCYDFPKALMEANEDEAMSAPKTDASSLLSGEGHKDDWSDKATSSSPESILMADTAPAAFSVTCSVLFPFSLPSVFFLSFLSRRQSYAALRLRIMLDGIGPFVSSQADNVSSEHPTWQPVALPTELR
ncbi:hypothetical protein ECG_07818 [Echinococcus granulosus]|nr:hypothetical protein ECG_07818 [Echinococcus granulosus]